MTRYIMRLTRLLVGLFVFTFGIVTTINAELGMSSWNCLNSGIIKHIDITFGQANIAIAVLLVLVTFLAKERIGLGTLGNMALVGTFMDIIQSNHLVPKANSLLIDRTRVL